MACKDKKAQAEYSRKHYYENKQSIKERRDKQIRKSKETIKEFIISYLEENPCIVCGESDTVVLEFDHRDRSTKDFSIAKGLQGKYSMLKLRKEIEKCDVLCANCHRRKTYTELGWNTRTR